MANNEIIPLRFTEVKFESLELEVAYRVYPDERRNQGHPDNRLPDVLSEIEIASVSVTDYPESRIKELLVETLKSRAEARD